MMKANPDACDLIAKHFAAVETLGDLPKSDYRID